MGNSYQVVADTLGSRKSRKVANNSYLCMTEGERDREGHPGQRGTIAYKLHETYVVLYHHNGSVELNSGGWRTVTTKDRINRCLRDYGPREYRVCSDRGVWYLYRDGIAVAGFADGMVIHPDGSLNGVDDTVAKHASNDRLNKLLGRYLRGLTPEVVARAIADDGGDCFYCKGIVSDAKLVNGKLVVAGPSESTDHLWDHLEERYYMYTLFANAVLAARHGSPSAVWAMIVADAKGENYDRQPRVSRLLTRDLSVYFRSALRCI